MPVVRTLRVRVDRVQFSAARQNEKSAFCGFFALCYNTKGFVEDLYGETEKDGAFGRRRGEDFDPCLSA